MNLEQLQAVARTLSGNRQSDNYGDGEIAFWLDEAQTRIVQQTKNLQDPSSPTLVNGAVSASTTLIVDDVKHFRPGDIIDIVGTDLLYDDNANTISSITPSTNTMTMATALTCADNGYIYWRNDFGKIALAAGTAAYPVPWSSLEVLQVLVRDSTGGTYRVLQQSDIRKRRTDRSRITAYTDGQDVTGTPSYWYLRGDHHIVLYPAPASAIVDGLWVHYVRKPLPLLMPTDEPEIDNSIHMSLAQYAAAMMLMIDGDGEKAGQLMQLFMSGTGMAFDAAGRPAEVPDMRRRA